MLLHLRLVAEVRIEFRGYVKGTSGSPIIIIYDTAKDMHPDPKNIHILVNWMIAPSVAAFAGLLSYYTSCIAGPLTASARSDGGRAFFKGAWTNKLSDTLVLVLYN